MGSLKEVAYCCNRSVSWKNPKQSQSLSINHSRAKLVILDGMKPPGCEPLVLSRAAAGEQLSARMWAQ